VATTARREQPSPRPVELAGDGAHVRLEVGDELADAGGETAPRTGHDRERVVERGAERDGAQARREVRRAGEGAGQVGVADPGGDEAQGDVLELDLDLGVRLTPSAWARSGSCRRIGSWSADSAS
jgi:hypothetical protein